MDTQNLAAVTLLVEGKTDTELLQALVTALTDNSDDLIGKLRNNANYVGRQIANIEIVATIAHHVTEQAIRAKRSVVRAEDSTP